MGLTNYIAQGGGTLYARWEIEGLPLEFVTDLAMEQTLADGRRRICVTTLDDCGFEIEESVNLPEATLEVRSTSLTLFETNDEDLSDLFHHKPTVERYCAVTFNDTATAITLLSTSGISAGDVIHIGTEAIKVGTVSSPSLGSCTRGYWGTEKRKHWASDTAGVPDLLVTDRPMRFRGRRVELHLYADDDNLQGNGTEVWRGLVSEEPRLVGDGDKYQIAMAGNALLLDQRLASDLEDPLTVRGIYYHAYAGLHFSVTENLSGTRSTYIGVYTGFSETQRDFLDSFNTWLGNVTSTADCTYEAVELPDGTWTILVVVGSLLTSIDQLVVDSEQDGFSYQRVEDCFFNGGPDLVGSRTLASGNRLHVRWRERPPGASLVPRGFFGDSPRAYLHWGPSAGTLPPDRLYFGRNASATWTAGVVSFEGGGAWEETAAFTSINTTDNHARWAGGTEGQTALYNPELPVEISIVRELRPDATPTYAGYGTVAELMDAITDEAVDYGDLGTAPFIVASDVEIARWTGPASRAAIVPWLRTRRYFLSQPEDLVEYLSMELRAAGLFLTTTSAGKLALAQLIIPNTTAPGITDITEEVSFIDEDGVALSSFARGNQTINRVVYKTGYDAIEDSWSGSETVNDKTAQAFDHQDRALAVEPKAWTDAPLSSYDAAALAAPVLTLFGYPHDYWFAKVPWTLFNLRLGSAVTFDASHLPDYASGNRPVTDAVGIVVRRRWALAEAFGEIQIIVPWQNIAGYSPTARITTTAVVTGNQWDLTLNHTLYAPIDTDGTTVLGNVDTFFAAGDQVKVINIDSESATVHVGEIDSINTTTHVARVTFDAAFTASGTQEMIFDHYDATGVTAAQKRFAAFGGSDDLLGAGNLNPRTLA